MKAIVLKCPAPAKFRFGQAGLDVNSSLSTTDFIPRSDTLFSAIINTAARIGGKTHADKIVKWFGKEDKIKISSAFYCLEYAKNQFIYLLPKPSCYEFFNTDTAQRKSIRKVQFISKQLWEQGITPDYWTKEHYLNKNVAMMPDEIKLVSSVSKLYNIITRPRITDQVRQPENNFYFQTELHLPQHPQIKTHFYFLLEEQLNEQKKEMRDFETILQVLCETGIGGRLSLGCGKLEDYFIDDSFALDIDESDENQGATLSLFSPKDEYEMQQLKHFQLILRGGRRIAGGNELEGEAPAGILKRLRMIQEGAIMQKEVVGNIQDVSPDNSKQYLRYGKAFIVPIHENILKYDTSNQQVAT